MSSQTGVLVVRVVAASVLVGAVFGLPVIVSAIGRGAGRSAGMPEASADDQTRQEVTGAMDSETMQGRYRELTPQEARVILHKGTEAPFTGEYTDLFADGVYTCRQCGAMLYRSEDKFGAHCGWPAFDDEIRGAVRRVPDADGQRTEILCESCGGHLGHVFEGERLTDKNVRHCVNSISMVFVPREEVKYGRAIFAAGCFWGVEWWLQNEPGVLGTTVGYIGGAAPDPTYEQVCGHTTGHAEAVEVIYDPVRVSFEKLAKLFFEIHDPTQVGGQGPDIGDQYRSEVFYTNDEQRAIAEKLISELEARGMDITTQVTKAPQFWPAEDYHQDWFAKKGSDAACHRKRKLW